MSDVIQEKVDASKGMRPARTVHTFPLPDSVPGEVRSVSVTELTAEEELMATRRAGTDAFKVAYELAKQSLVAVNGEKVSLADGTSDKVWVAMHPKARALTIIAYNAVHQPADNDVADFLKGQTIQVG